MLTFVARAVVEGVDWEHMLQAIDIVDAQDIAVWMLEETNYTLLEVYPL